MDLMRWLARVILVALLNPVAGWAAPNPLAATGTLDRHRVRDEWLQWKNIARSFGYFFFGLGIILLLLIIYAMATRLVYWQQSRLNLG